METNLDQVVVARLKARKGDWKAIATSAGVSYSWLSKFSNGHIPNPGYATLTRLHGILCGPVITVATAEPVAQQGA